MSSPLNLYDVSIPEFIHKLNTLSTIILQKAVDTAESKSLDAATFPSCKLAPDMRDLTFQVVIATSMAKRLAVTLVGAPDADFGSDEKTIADLQARIAKAVEYLSQIKREDFEGKEGVEVEVFGRKVTGLDFVNKVIIPNFYFHVVTAYDILRAQGIDLGKMDFLGQPKK